MGIEKEVVGRSSLVVGCATSDAGQLYLLEFVAGETGAANIPRLRDPGPKSFANRLRIA
jgi:hypothetical protein